MPDPLYMTRELLLSGDGTAGSHDITDASQYRTVLSSTHVTVDAAQSRFGGQSLAFAGTGALQYPPGDRWAVGLERGKPRWSMEGWVRFAPGSLTNRTPHLWQIAESNDRRVNLHVANGTLSLFLGAPPAVWQETGGTIARFGTVPEGQWLHIFLGWRRGDGTDGVFNDTAWVFVDGVLRGAVRSNMSPTYLPDTGATLCLGGQPTGPQVVDDLFVGHMDDVRFTKGWFRIPQDAADVLPAGELPTALGVPSMRAHGNRIAAVSHVPAGLRLRLQPDVRLDTEHGGRHQITGTVHVDGTPPTPVRRRVRLYRDVDGLLVRETWSDASTGAYAFRDLSARWTYSVVSTDHTLDKRAVIADRVTPEPMP